MDIIYLQVLFYIFFSGIFSSLFFYLFHINKLVMEMLNVMIRKQRAWQALIIGSAFLSLLYIIK